IQIDEPAILRSPQEFSLLKEALAPIAAAKGSSRLAFCVYFGDSSKIYKRLQGLPVDELILDFTYAGERLAEVVKTEGTQKTLGLGLVDGRNTRLEPENEIAAAAERIASSLKTDRVILCPSSGLEYLPREKAFAKLALLGKIR